MLRGWHHHYAGLSLHGVALNVFDRSEKRSTESGEPSERAKGLKLKPSYEPKHQLEPRLLRPVDSINILNEYNIADPYFSGFKHRSRPAPSDSV